MSLPLADRMSSPRLKRQPKSWHGQQERAVASAMRRLLDHDARAGSLSEAHRGSIRVREAVDLIVPALDVEPDVETGREIER